MIQAPHPHHMHTISRVDGNVESLDIDNSMMGSNFGGNLTNNVDGVSLMSGQVENMATDNRPRSGGNRNMGSSITAALITTLRPTIMFIIVSIRDDKDAVMEMINNIIHKQDSSAETISSIYCQSNI